jgi:acetate kinase
VNEARQPVAGDNVDVRVLALNTGSSSLKFGLYRARAGGMACLLAGEAEGFGEASASFHAADAQGVSLFRETCVMANAGDAVVRVGQLLAANHAWLPNAIGHRIVHGGPRLRQHGLIDAQLLTQLEAAAAFAPLHTPQALAVIRYAQQHFPGLPQVACLDTCFHAGMPPVASTLPLPRDLRAAGIQRYGFHGLSCESIVRQFGSALPERLIIAHLGNGASITAVRQGVSIDTSMGLTPTGGVIMGTRSGDLDPGVLVHLMREMKLDATAIEHLVDHRCGLLGLSGLSGDMRALHDAAAANGEVRLAIDMFCYSVAKEIGAMGMALDGVDQIVFTGGIGEHDARVRAKVCARLSSLGVELDAARNQHGLGLVSRDASRCAVRVLPSQEDEQIARHTWALCGRKA